MLKNKSDEESPKSIVRRSKHVTVSQVTFEKDAAQIDRQANLKRRFPSLADRMWPCAGLLEYGNAFPLIANLRLVVTS